MFCYVSICLDLSFLFKFLSCSEENYGYVVLGCLDLIDAFLFLHDHGLISCLRSHSLDLRSRFNFTSCYDVSFFVAFHICSLLCFPCFFCEEDEVVKKFLLYRTLCRGLSVLIYFVCPFRESLVELIK